MSFIFTRQLFCKININYIIYIFKSFLHSGCQLKLIFYAKIYSNTVLKYNI